MSQKLLFTRLLALISLGAVIGCQSTDNDPETRPGGWSPLEDVAIQQALNGTVNFKQHVKPVLEAKCATCHNTASPAAGLNLTLKSSAFATGPKGPRIVPGNPSGSVLVENITATHDKVNVMPQVGNRVTKEEVSIIKRWIKQGAPWEE